MILRNVPLKVLILFITMFNINFAQWQPTSGPEAGHINDIINFNNEIFCGTQTGDIFSSTDDGTTWIYKGTIDVETSEQLNTIAANSTSLFAGTFTKLFRSNDAGVNWTPVINNIHVEKIITVNENIFASAQNGVYTSTDNGLNWLNITSDLPGTYITSISSHGSDLFVSVFDHGVYKSTNNGASWNLANTGITSDRIKFLSSDGNRLYAVFSGKAEVFYSTNAGLNWNTGDLISGNSAFESVLSLFTSPSGIYAGVIYQGSIFSPIRGGVYKSSDGGVNWILHDEGLTNKYVRSIFSAGNTLLAGTQKGGVFRSSDGGINWATSSTGIRKAEVRHIAFSNNGADFFAGVYGGGFYTSNDSGQTWMDANSGIAFASFPTVSQYLVKGTFRFIATENNGIFRSSDNGVTWTAVNTFLDNLDIIALIVRGNDLIAGSGGGFDGIYRSTDNGDTWTNIAQGTFILGVGSLAAGGAGTIFAGGGFNSAGVMRTTNNGANWLQSKGLPGVSVTALRFIGTKMFAGTAGEGVYTSTDFGITWAPSNTGMENAEVTFIATQDTMNIFASTRNEGVHRSTDAGESWHQINEGLPINSVWCIRITLTHIYAGTNGYSVWRRHLSDLVTDVDEITDNNIPFYFDLFQNYPNPFNPSTKISWQSPVGSWQTLKVYDLLGREVATLVNEYKPAGSYEVEFNIHSGENRNLTSGVYFYQLKAGDPSAGSEKGFVETRKMVVLK